MRPPLQLHQEAPGLKKYLQMATASVPMGPYLLHVSCRTQEGWEKAIGLFLDQQLPMTDTRGGSHRQEVATGNTVGQTGLAKPPSYRDT